MSRERTLFLVVLVLFCTALGLASLRRGHDWGGDFSAYIMQAQSLVEGTPGSFVAANARTMEESSYATGPAAYPWGYSASLAPLVAVAGNQPLILKLVNVLYFLALLVAVYLLVRPRLSYLNSLLVVAMIGVSPAILRFLDMLTSDVAFMAASAASLVAIDRRYILRSRPLRPNIRDALVGLAILAACSLRGNGVLLLAVLLVAHLVHFRKCRSRISARTGTALIPYGIPYLVVLIPGGVMAVTLPSGIEWYIELMDLVSLHSIPDRAVRYLGALADYFTIPFREVVYGGSMLLFAVGLVRSLERDHPLAVYLILTLSLIVVWPGYQGFRYLLPIVPILVYFAVNSVDRTHPRWRATGALRIVGYCWLLAIVGVFGVKSMRGAWINLNGRATIEGPYTPASGEMFRFVRARTSEHARLIFYKPRVMRLMTERHSVLLLDPSGMRSGDVYVHRFSEEAESQLPEATLERLIRSQRLQPIFESDAFGVYRVRAHSSPPGGDAGLVPGIQPVVPDRTSSGRSPPMQIAPSLARPGALEASAGRGPRSR